MNKTGLAPPCGSLRLGLVASTLADLHGAVVDWLGAGHGAQVVVREEDGTRIGNQRYFEALEQRVTLEVHLGVMDGSETSRKGNLGPNLEDAASLSGLEVEREEDLPDRSIDQDQSHDENTDVMMIPKEHVILDTGILANLDICSNEFLFPEPEVILKIEVEDEIQIDEEGKTLVFKRVNDNISMSNTETTDSEPEVEPSRKGRKNLLKWLLRKQDEDCSEEIKSTNHNAKRKSDFNLNSPVSKKRKCVYGDSCLGCVLPECGVCLHCLDKPSRGGPNKTKQKCIHRKCRVSELTSTETTSIKLNTTESGAAEQNTEDSLNMTCKICSKVYVRIEYFKKHMKSHEV